MIKANELHFSKSCTGFARLIVARHLKLKCILTYMKKILNVDGRISVGECHACPLTVDSDASSGRAREPKNNASH